MSTTRTLIAATLAAAALAGCGTTNTTTTTTVASAGPNAPTVAQIVADHQTLFDYCTQRAPRRDAVNAAVDLRHLGVLYLDSTIRARPALKAYPNGETMRDLLGYDSGVMRACHDSRLATFLADGHPQP